jgi:hypothetical protein
MPCRCALVELALVQGFERAEERVVQRQHPLAVARPGFFEPDSDDLDVWEQVLYTLNRPSALWER